jgi:hypothetical protein
MKKSSVLQLECLYDFVRKNRNAGDDALRLKGSDYGREYSRLCDRLVAEIDGVAGFYLWGRYDRKRCWHSIYLGIAGYKKKGTKKGTNLKSRIREELMDERAFVWRFVYDEVKLQETCKRIHMGRYSWERPFRKAGATEIVWVRARRPLTTRQIQLVEADLIEALNPAANRSRPSPGNSVQHYATKVFSQLRKVIHENRPNKKISRLHGSVETWLKKEADGVR